MNKFRWTNALVVVACLCSGDGFADNGSSQQIQMLNSQIQAQMQQMQEIQQKQVKEMNLKIQAQLKELQSTLQDQIQKVNTQNQTALKQLKDSFQAEINQLQDQIGAKKTSAKSH